MLYSVISKKERLITKTQKTKAIYLMLISSLSFSIMQVFVKLSSEEVGTFEQTFFETLSV